MRKKAAKRINLALQGGGAHGAFTWGVLDEVLRDGRLIVDGITGASAGAVNAVLLADGLAEGRGGCPRATVALLAGRLHRRRHDGGAAPGAGSAVLGDALRGLADGDVGQLGAALLLAL